MVACNCLIYKDEHLISWDSLSNDELHMIMDKLREKFDIANLFEDGMLVVSQYTMDANLNKEFYITDEFRGELVSKSIARERYNNGDIIHHRESTYLSRYITFIPRDETPEGHDIPPAEPADPDNIRYVFSFKNPPTVVLYDDIRAIIYGFLVKYYPKIKSDAKKIIVNDDSIVLCRRVLNKIKGGTIMYSPRDITKCCSFYIK